MRHKKLSEPTPKQNKMIQEAVALHQAGQLDAAETQYRKLLKSLPSNIDLLNNLGMIAFQKGLLEDGVRIIERSLQINPNQPYSLNNYGNALKDLKRLDKALVIYDRAIALKPDYAIAYSNRGLVLHDLDRLDDALKSYDLAITIKPDYAVALFNRGIVLQDLNRLDEALENFDCAIAHNPNYAVALFNRGIALQELKRLDEALTSYDRAITINPDYADAHYNRGLALQDLRRQDEALVSYDRAIAIKPDYAVAYSNRGNTLQDLKRLDEALASFDCAIAIKPNYAVAFFNRGITLQDLKRLDEALVSFDCAIAQKADIDFILGYSLHAKMGLCFWDDLPHRLNELNHKINNNKKVAIPFTVLGLFDNPKMQKKTAEIFANEKYPQNHVLPKIDRYPHHSKIRIGYFSADFRNHPVSNLTVELYETHDRNQFEIYAFSFGPDTKDQINLRIKAGVDHFHDVRSLSDKEVALFARSLEIDIALDLGGYTQDCRTGIFAMQTAPIQLNYLGYPGTMAVDYIDYIIADPTLIPEDSKQYFSEKIVYLPNSYMVNDTKGKVSDRVFTPTEAGLPTNSFIFCSFNQHYKITPTVFAGWMRILLQVDNSVLWLPKGNSTAMINLKKEAVKSGVAEDRLIFAPRLTHMEDHFMRIKLADLFLDTLPFNAHTTTSDALRMGLPVLTLIGESFASRVAASLLNAVNLPELITTTQEQYESLAIDLALHPEKLKALKEKLANNLPTAPLYNTPLFTQHLESAYLSMYDRYQKGLAPEHIYVEP